MFIFTDCIFICLFSFISHVVYLAANKNDRLWMDVLILHLVPVNVKISIYVSLEVWYRHWLNVVLYSFLSIISKFGQKTKCSMKISELIACLYMFNTSTFWLMALFQSLNDIRHFRENFILSPSNNFCNHLWTIKRSLFENSLELKEIQAVK